MKKILLFTLQLFFICQVANAQNFVTTWNVLYGSDISFRATTTGPVAYTWLTLAPAAPASGSGTFSGPNVTITGLPDNALIQLSIEPQNLTRFRTAANSNAVLNFDLRNVNQWGAVQWTSMEDAFAFSGYLQVNATDIPNLFGVTSMKNMFLGCASMNSPFNLNAWNISTITNLSGTFSGCGSFNQALSLWNTSNVTDMSRLFENALVFNLNIGNWNTANVSNMLQMFRGATFFNKSIANWNTANVTNMSEMFADPNFESATIQFNQYIGGWNTTAVTNMSGMFSGAYSFNQNIAPWNATNVTDMSRMFQKAYNFNQNIGGWNTANVVNMERMFSSGELIELPEYAFANGGSATIENWNVSNVSNMSGMFANAIAFNYNLSNWNLNQQVDLTQMLDNSGLDCNKYTQTLIGWSNNPTIPSNRILGATFLEYNTDAQDAVTNLTINKGWGFSGHDINSTVASFEIPTVFCQGATIPALPTVSTNGIEGVWQPALNSEATTTYVFTPNPGQCSASSSLTITINTLPVLSGESIQILGENTTIADLIVSPSAVTWYTSLQNALNNTNPLISTTALTNNTTYYAVNNDGQCSSAPFAVTVTISLKVDGFDKQFLKFYPNPVSSVLNISYNRVIESVKVYNLLGQILMDETPNAADVILDMSRVPNGIYMIKINSDNENGDFKVVKK